jgi:hypothetical protein
MSDSRFAPCGSDAASVPRSDWGDGQFGALDGSGAAVLRLGFDPQVVAARKDQKAAVSASMLDRDGHQGLDQPVEQELARHRLRYAITVARSRCSSEVSTVGKCAWETSGWRRSSWASLANAPQRR